MSDDKAKQVLDAALAQAVHAAADRFDAAAKEAKQAGLDVFVSCDELRITIKREYRR